MTQELTREERIMVDWCHADVLLELANREDV